MRISVKDPNFLKLLINKELEPFGVDYEFVKNHPTIDGIDWFRFYTFDTAGEYEQWRDFCIKQFMESRERLSYQKAVNEFSYLDLKYGLSQKYLVQT